jgi:phthiodiolone/phenolphthiodiolone dimycocerosates ketoreductase
MYGAAMVTTSIPLISDRFTPPAAFAAYAQGAAASGVVDELLVWDQMTNFWPRQLWNPENSPLAALLPDIDSYADAYVLSAYVLAAAPNLGITVSTDAIRRGPAELFQTMLTLQNMSAGRITVMMGAGEAKQATPYGWKRSEGLARLEDQFHSFHALWDATSGPVDTTGNHWSLKNAWMGSARGARPHLWALGGGPKLLDLGTSYSDGMAAIVPSVYPTPESFGVGIGELKKTLVEKGRDPEAFGFGLWFMAAVHEDEEVIRKALRGKLLRYMAGIAGRVEMAAWTREGITPPMPEDWHYAVKLRPVEWTDTQIEEFLDRITDEIVERSYVKGTPEQVAAQVQPYVDAGATWVSVCDLMPLVLEPEDAQQALGRNIEICRRLKAAG